MTKLFLDYLDHGEWEIAVVFSNIGKEREGTFQFILDCDRYFGFNTVWVEPVVNPIRGLGTPHKVVNYFTADCKGVPFEEVILKYGLPNVVCKSCTRDIKIIIPQLISGLMSPTGLKKIGKGEVLSIP